MNTMLLLDVATSGFDPKKDVILEIAILLVSADPSLEVLDSAHHVVFHPAEDPLSVPEFHRTNGLFAATEFGGGIRRVEAALLAGPWSRATRLVGRSPDFERKFLSAHMPTFARGLPAAKLDINDVEWFATTIGGVPAVPRTEPRTYRAEDDVVEAYEALRHYQSALWNVNAGP